MAIDQSVVYVCSDADRAAANAVMAAFYGDAPNSPELSRRLCPANVDPLNATTTHWAGASPHDAAGATALKDWPTGTLPPGVNWAAYSLTEPQALAGGAVMTISVMTGPDMEGLPMTNFMATCSALGLQPVQFDL